MAAHQSSTRRLHHEIPALLLSTNDFIVSLPTDDMYAMEAIILPPKDSMYAHKFVRLAIRIPKDYPYKPPAVTFVNRRGGRVHPNLYVDGKVCLSILGTWTGPGWRATMGIETVLRSIQSILGKTNKQTNNTTSSAASASAKH
jgi:ubiquitin-conjugating enzyme E2 Z